MSTQVSDNPCTDFDDRGRSRIEMMAHCLLDRTGRQWVKVVPPGTPINKPQMAWFDKYAGCVLEAKLIIEDNSWNWEIQGTPGEELIAADTAPVWHPSRCLDPQFVTKPATIFDIAEIGSHG